MGGRGSESTPGGDALRPPWRYPVGGGGSAYIKEESSLPYTVIRPETALGGAVYPFLAQTRRAWRIVVQPVDKLGDVAVADTFGQTTPTLRWVNGDQVTDLYVDGMDTQQFLDQTGLKLSLKKGSFVLSKRISRLMRPHFVSGFFPPDDVTIAYMDQSQQEAKVWDGAGLMSRRMLDKLALAEDLSPSRRARLQRELAHAGRVEFTVMTDAGQDKEHAIVVDDLRDDDGRAVDFLLPKDTKGEISLTNGRRFVGVNFVHGKEQMRLDVQSLINLHPFFDEKQLHEWLGQEGDLFAAGLNGDVVAAMRRLEAHTSLAEVESWPLREYLASGGDPRWFAGHTKSLMNRHLDRLNYQTLEKLRLPIPGARHYVMPTAVAQRAGIEVAVPKGHIHLDAHRGTAWVNDADWLSLPDSPQGQGIAGILGGADHDDALWLHAFTDHDGTEKILAWRSPNQVGEYIVLRPTENSAIPEWATGSGSGRIIRFPDADSRKLPPRIDHLEPAYLGLVDANTAGGLGEGAETYTVEVMDTAVNRALANKGALGMYCNSLMLNKALFDGLPEQPPAPLEDIIDSAVKTGADLSQVVAWNYANSREILDSGTPIPAVLHKRLSLDRTAEERPPRPRFSTDHWLDETVAGIEGHIEKMTAVRDEMAAAAKPPLALLEAAFAEPETIIIGAGLNKTFAAALREPLPPITALNGETLTKAQRAAIRQAQQQARYERARRAVWDSLHHHHPERHNAILRGAMVSALLSGGSDAAVWQAGEKERSGRTTAGDWAQVRRGAAGDWAAGEPPGERAGTAAGRGNGRGPREDRGSRNGLHHPAHPGSVVPSSPPTGGTASDEYGRYEPTDTSGSAASVGRTCADSLPRYAPVYKGRERPQSSLHRCGRKGRAGHFGNGRTGERRPNHHPPLRPGARRRFTGSGHSGTSRRIGHG
ncbi:MAG: hypothetical protein IPM76_21640 [Chloroflexi bacterium]|nr:hypothetical protein [Chloroflexota bacterium]